MLLLLFVFQQLSCKTKQQVQADCALLPINTTT